MRILIVDDSHTMRAILSTYARNAGLDSVEAEDGRQGLDCLRKAGPFDAALVDWDMPVMNGMELLKALRADPSLAGLKVLMVTAQNTYDKVSEALAAGADDYLMKPLDEAMFTEKLCVLGLLS